jgi:cell division protein FtsA
MRHREIAAGLDVGTTKVCVVAAEIGEDGGLSILGVGDRPCSGLERGSVINLEATIQSVTEAVRACEQMAGISIKSVMAGIAGEHIRSVNSTGVIGVSRRDNEITREDVKRVLDAARAVPVPGDREVLHVLPRDYRVDEQRGIRDPVGMSGVRLEVEVHIVTAQTTAVKNLLRGITRAGLTVGSLVLEPLAAAEAVLDDDEKALGVLLLDIGGGTTDIAVFLDGTIGHTAVVGFGGNAVTNDLAVGLRTPIEQAEKLKLLHGCAVAAQADAGAVVEVPGVGGRDPRRVGAGVLASIIEPRMEEILGLVLAEVERVVDPSLLAGGVVLTGGSAQMRLLPELAERVLGLPARVGVPDHFSGLADLALDPRLATAVGLVRHAVAEECTQKVRRGLFGRGHRPWRDVVGDYFS